MSSVENQWCRRYVPAQAPTARLVCLPHAGGSAPYFRPVSLALGKEFDVVAVQYPGRQDRRSEPPITEMSVLADRVAEILAAEDDLPLTLFGHSLGAILAFEVARRLEAGGRPPARIVASGRRGPSTHRDEALHRLDDAGLIAELRAGEGTVSVLLEDEELMRAALPALRADYQVAELYGCDPSVTVSSPITVLTGDNDPKTTLDEARTWEAHTTGGFEFEVYPGGHFFLSQHIAPIIALLRGHLSGRSAPVQ
ncbi:putative thioesterase [Actinacidiphila reveromycinica]|uniref:Putative thioesterase n=1 Tax=Actinacidiphila reveromycinica TaxID=659352 RepID=A0A7U3V0J0_9ACTN|nr:alpha/beta fold hydrolase [Streptomyces sp. SN-593]BBB02237.1 putative thioesterase [Streptomyces sp. SN-593]